jgi:hypothetical protein
MSIVYNKSFIFVYYSITVLFILYYYQNKIQIWHHDQRKKGK